MQEEQTRPHNISELNQLFTDGEGADKSLYSEQRSNLQLIAGEHYAKRGNNTFWNRIQDSKNVPPDQRIRLTKNHIRRIVLTYRNSITTYAPGVTSGPKDKASIQHQKSSELINSVWDYGKSKYDFNQKINQWVSDFVGIGEVFTKTYFDPNAGRFLGYESKIDDQTGQPALDEMGQPVSSGVPRFVGDVLIDRLYAFNIVRHQNAKTMDESPFLCHRKMVEVKDLKSLVEQSSSLDDDEKRKIIQKITESSDETYIILDGNTGQYRQTKGQTMLREFFWRPGMQYPQGYFQICAKEDIVFEGELPFGLFPIDNAGFDEIQTSPRCRSIVKQARPYQIEINRTASKIAETQITLGDDKVLTQNGTHLTPGMSFPGIRSFQYSGMAPIVMEGRTGQQYLEYMNSQITEMYAACMVNEQNEEKQEKFDPYTSLYKSIKDKKKFSVYTDTFESFLKKVFFKYISTCQKYFTPQHLIPAIGKSEYINIDEFKNTDELCYVIKVENQTDDSETKLGKQLAIQHVIQYVGPQLAKEDLGKIIRLMPYTNDEQILEDLTMDYDFANNLILALDRGKSLPPNNSNPAYTIKKLTNRISKPDFEFLGPQIKMIYDQTIQMYQQVKTDEEIKIKQAQSEFIPTGGYLVACDFYVPDKTDPSKLPKRIRIPSESLDWLLKQMEVQGTNQQTLEGLNKGAQSQMADMFMKKLQMGAGQSQPMPTLPMGQTRPGGF